MPLANNTRNLTDQNKARARKLRREMTLSEKKLWSYIRAKRLGFLFRRQYPVGDLVLDFYCPEVKLCVEVDGPHHADRVQQDANRDAFLESLGILTIRIPSIDLFDREYPVLEKWLDLIERTCRERKTGSLGS